MPDTRAKNEIYKKIYFCLQPLVLFFLECYSYCQAQSSQASARLSGFIITWWNLTPHPPQTGIVVRWRPRKLKFTVLPSFNITRDIMETYNHQLFSQIQHTQSKCLTLVPKLKYTRKYILAYPACTIFQKLYLLPSSVKSSLSLTEWLYYHLIKFDTSPPSSGCRLRYIFLYILFLAQV